MRSPRTEHSIGRLAGATAILATAALAGCASLNTVRADVASYGTWPGDAVPGTYTFDRLPSQDKDPKRAERLELAAAHALEGAGFKAAPEGAKGTYSVQIGARVDRTEPDPWDDPFWMPGLYHRPFGPWMSPYGPYWRPWGYPYGYGPYGPYPDQYQREVALLIRDAASGKPLYEARATSTGNTEGSDRLITAMFDAALKEFPKTDDHAHSVSVEMPLAPQP
jgi:hypothetical protein